MSSDDRETRGHEPEFRDETASHRDSDIDADFEVDFTVIREDQPVALTEPGGDHDAEEQPQFDRIDRYRIERLLGRGGFGSVYLARDEQLDRLVAVKIAHSNLITSLTDASLYLEEARNVAKLDHPHIVPVHDAGATPEVPFYFVSKYIDGANLATTLHESPVNHYAAAKIAATIAGALQHAHKHGLVHRDVKPGNILIDREGIPYLVDFGLALSEESAEAERRYVGTPSYTSPEQARGEGHRVDGRSDVFSLGVVLYEMLTHRRPFRGKKKGAILQQVTSYEPRPPRQYDESIPKQLDRICQKAMAKLASERYQSAFDMAEDLQHFLTANEVTRESAASTAPPMGAGTIGHPPADTNRGNVVTDRASRTADASLESATADESASATQVRSETSSSRGLSIVPKGIRSFDAHDSDFFLELIPGARDRDGFPESIRFWRTRLEEVRPEKTFPVGLIYGPSGCGKSSLVQAGLLPRLSKHVSAVFVESTAEETESRLLTALRSQCPTLPRDRSLIDLIKMIRNGYGPPADNKILIVLDQFEQWLHAHATEAAGALVQALRQCDGSRVQTLIMVRDDFWMAATGFMRELEVRISEGQNAAAVDLFPVRHAVKVLDAYGRAFGSLPKPPGSLSADQRAFLQQASEELAQDGKVICVRLALFAEIMRSRPWTVESLRTVGGAQGVGLKFLEETFDGVSAPLSYRYHEAAARRALQQLLPSAGQSIRGHTRTSDELNLASGYRVGSKDFSELMTILDTEVRLITPCDAVTSRRDEECDDHQDRGDRRYQLTHDYLVQSLRTWLTQKQRETRRGRAELLLSERASLWSSKPESRHLPTLGEDLRIRWLTDRNRWSDDEQRMMSRGRRVHGLRVATVALLAVLLAMSAVGYRRYLKADSMVSSLVKADISELTGMLDSIETLKFWATPKLINRFEASEDESKERFRLSVALLQDDPRAEDYLIDQLPKLALDEFSVVCENLQPSDESIESLWKVTQDESRSAAQRFQAGCALALFEPQGESWDSFDQQMITFLVTDDTAVPSRQLMARLDHLRPAGELFSEGLRDLLRDASITSFARERSAIALARFLSDQPNELVDILMTCRTRNELEPFVTELSPHFSTVMDRLETIATEEMNESPGIRYQAEHHQIAIATATLAHFGKIEWLLAMFKLPVDQAVWDPSLRSLTKHYLSEMSIDFEASMAALADPELDADVIRELVQVLGQRGTRGLSGDEFTTTVKHLSRLSTSHPDSGVHRMEWNHRLGFIQAGCFAVWALSKLGVSPAIESVDLPRMDETVRSTLSQFETLIKAKEKERVVEWKAVPDRRAQWERSLVEQADKDADPNSDESLLFRFALDGPEEYSLKTSLVDTESVEQQIRKLTKDHAVKGYCAEFDGETSLDFGDTLQVDRDQAFSYGCWFFNRKPEDYVALFSRMASGPERRGFDLWFNGKRIGAHLVHSEPNNYIKVVTAQEQNLYQWNHLFMTYDGSSKAEGLKVYVNGVLERPLPISNTLDSTIQTDVPTLVGSRLGDFFFSGWLDDVRFYQRELSAEDIRTIFDSAIRSVLRKSEEDRTSEQADTLRRAYRDDVVSQIDEDLEGLRTAYNKIASEHWGGQRRWFVNGQGQSFAVLPSSLSRPGEVSINHDVSISVHEVTTEQFDRSGINRSADPDPEESPQCPVHRVSWFNAAEYCNWLSAQEGILEDHWCYKPNSDGNYDWGMVLKPNYRELRGYRLPTRDEMLYAGRYHSNTRFFFGESGEVVNEYSWFAGNAIGMTKPVGLLAPNGFGIFDIHGNVWEWTHDLDGIGESGEVTEGCRSRLLFGAMNSALHIVGFGAHADTGPEYVGHYNGFRLARSLLASDDPESTD